MNWLFNSLPKNDYKESSNKYLIEDQDKSDELDKKSETVTKKNII